MYTRVQQDSQHLQAVAQQRMAKRMRSPHAGRQAGRHSSRMWSPPATRHHHPPPPPTPLPPPAPPRPQAFVQRVLRSYDASKSGMLSSEQLSHAMDRLDVGLDPQQKEQLLARVAPGGASVHYMDFLKSFDAPTPLGAPGQVGTLPREGLKVGGPARGGSRSRRAQWGAVRGCWGAAEAAPHACGHAG